MKWAKYTGLFVLLTSWLLGCVSVSQKNYEQAQKSMAQGAYQQAFDQAVRSLESEISNHQTIALFPSIVERAYVQKEGDIANDKARNDWDRVALSYDRITAMNRSLQNIQTSLSSFSQTARVSDVQRLAINNLLAVQPRHVDGERQAVYQHAAEAHYARGIRYQSAKDYRLASTSFQKALSFVRPFKDAQAREKKTKHLADLADAKMYYQQAQAYVQNHEYRAASLAFSKAGGLILGYKNSDQLEIKYRDMADQQDALSNYLEGQRLANNHQYRAAIVSFQRSLSFVPNYKDARALVIHYTEKANRQDAKKHYAQGEVWMNGQEFKRAAMEFDRAERFMPGFRDARAKANRARYLMPPRPYELRAAVQRSVRKGVPLSWLDDVHTGYTEEVKISSVQTLRRGNFNTRYEYWPYRLHVRGTANLEVPNAEEKEVVFNTTVDFRIYRNDFGEWQANSTKR